jgi:hypothetical protein
MDRVKLKVCWREGQTDVTSGPPERARERAGGVRI